MKGPVLIVDDNDETVRMLAMTLRFMGYSSQLAHSVAQAQSVLGLGETALVLTDWLLLDGTGEDVCSVAREVSPTMPVVVVSGLYDEHRHAVARCKPDAYLNKPVDMDALQATLERLLAPQKGCNDLNHFTL